MKHTLFVLIAIALLFTTVFLFPGDSLTQSPAICPPDKALCARMLRFGKQAYLRGKYLDAKEYFRKAVQADSTSLKAWQYYDQAMIFALAEKVEKNANLVLPDISGRPEPPAGQSQAVPPPIPAPIQKQAPAAPPKGAGGFTFKIVDDEGC